MVGWANEIHRKGDSGKVVAIGMAWNGSGCLVKKAPNREEGGFSVRILRDGAALVWTVSRPGGGHRGGGPLQSAAQRFGEEGQQFRDLRRGGRVRKQPGNPAGPRGGQAGLGHLHAAGEQARHKAGDEIARASDGLQSGNLRFGYVAEEPPAFHKVIDLPFDEQEARGVSVLIGAFDEAWDILIRGQQEPPGVKRVRRLFIGKEGQFPGIGGEQIVGVGVAAHLGHIHIARVGRQQGAKPRDILFHDLPSLEAKLQDLGLF